MTIFNDLKFESIMLAEEIRTLRKWEQRYGRKAKAALMRSRSNYPLNYERRRECYLERKMVSREARYLHLIRAFIKGTPYSVVEETTKENNKMDMDTLMEAFKEYGFCPEREWIEQWVAS